MWGYQVAWLSNPHCYPYWSSIQCSQKWVPWPNSVGNTREFSTTSKYPVIPPAELWNWKLGVKEGDSSIISHILGTHEAEKRCPTSSVNPLFNFLTASMKLATADNISFFRLLEGNDGKYWCDGAENWGSWEDKNQTRGQAPGSG